MENTGLLALTSKVCRYIWNEYQGNDVQIWQGLEAARDSNKAWGLLAANRFDLLRNKPGLLRVKKAFEVVGVLSMKKEGNRVDHKMPRNNFECVSLTHTAYRSSRDWKERYQQPAHQVWTRLMWLALQEGYTRPNLKVRLSWKNARGSKSNPECLLGWYIRRVKLYAKLNRQRANQCFLSLSRIEMIVERSMDSNDRRDYSSPHLP